LEVDIRGRIYRFSTSAIDVLNSDPTLGPAVFRYPGGLEMLDYEEVQSIDSPESGAREVSVSALFNAAQLEGWSSISDPTSDIGQSKGELSLLIEGQGYTDRTVVVRGFIDSPTYGGKHEPVSFTITESDYLDTGAHPPIAAVVDGNTWPRWADGVYAPDPAYSPEFSAAESAIGQAYPWIFGRPGLNAPATFPSVHGYLPATPALIVGAYDPEPDPGATADADNIGKPIYIVIAGHETWVDSSFTAGGLAMPGGVYLWNDGGDSDYLDAHVTNVVVRPFIDGSGHAHDGTGRKVTMIAVSGPGSSGAAPPFGSLELTAGSEVWVSWPGRGGVLNKHRTGPITGAGEVIEYLLDHSDLRVNKLKTRVVLNEVNGYKLDFWINEPRSPWAIINEDILPVLPMTAQVTHDGLSFTFWRWDATAADAVEHIDIQQNEGYRDGSVEVSSANDVYNEISIDYCRHGPSGDYKKRLTYAPRNLDNLEGVQANPYSWASFTRYGRRIADPIEAPTVESDVTARAILDWKIRYLSQTRRSVRYVLPQRYQSLDVGSVVTVTDTGIGFDRTVCIISGLLRVPGSTEIQLVTVPHWARDALI